ncbi:hypothetical protein NI17_003075 [Thermobifida halotolerans]|uniref:Uncharacterized protein n=1 Tax=Thermobifida halotolerans TaxID=483545 RepID=A0AA97M4I6_9ACTN|nr:hypothetical protein [Thermobifida halotolerans]UOE20243.1 hypothetical protein NI17_003075 [Thermobifida halotolerans]
MPAPLTTRAAIEAAITARELDPTHPVFPEAFWNHPAVARLSPPSSAWPALSPPSPRSTSPGWPA